MPELFHLIEVEKAKELKQVKFQSELIRKQTYYLFPGSVSEFDGDLRKFWPFPWDEESLKLEEKAQAEKWTDEAVNRVLSKWDKQIKEKNGG